MPITVKKNIITILGIPVVDQYVYAYELHELKIFFEFFRSIFFLNFVPDLAESRARELEYNTLYA